MASLSATSLGGEQLAGTILLVTTIPNNYSGMLPSLFTISSPFFHAQEARSGNVKRIRQGEAIATAISLAEAWAVMRLTGSVLPMIGSLIMIAVLVAAYEYALAHPATSEDDGGLV